MATLPSDYQSFSAQDKVNVLFNQCPGTSDQSGSPVSLSDLVKMLFRNLNPTFDHGQDEKY